MKTLRTRTLLSALAAAALAAACGGNDAVPTAAESMVRQISAAQPASPEGRKQALALSPATVDVDALFDWAQYKYPDLFPAAGMLKFNLTYQGVNYKIRWYTTENYLGLTDANEIWGLGPFTNNVLTPVGPLAAFAPLVVADECKVYPNNPGCGSNPAPTGALNECAHPSMDTLPTGFRSHLIYQYTGTLTGDQTIDTVIDGPGFTFEGKSRIRITNTTSGTNAIQGFTITTTTEIKSFHDITGGVARTYGSLIDASTTTSGFNIPGNSSKVVFDPARDNWEFRLALGQTATVSYTTTTTPISPPGLPMTATLPETVTFEAKEGVTVPAGTFQACRYRTAGSTANSYSLVWYILGKGIPAKIQSITNGVATDMQELKAGSTFGGAPL